jgi:glycosyltransferase involved in cell wall biosynthesis
VNRGCGVTVFTSKPHSAPRAEVLDRVNIRRYGNANTYSGLLTAYNSILNAIKQKLNAFDLLYLPLAIGDKFPIQPQIEISQLFKKARKPVVIRITSSGRVTEMVQRKPESSTVLRNANKVIALNSDISTELNRAGVKPRNIFTIANGTDIRVFCPNTGVQQKAPKFARFICPCRISAKKGILEMIRDWDELNTDYPIMRSSELSILGDRNLGTEDLALYQSVRQAVKTAKYSNIRLRPSVSYELMPSLYQASDIFISYSHQEGMSNAALEAMATGLPLICPMSAAFIPLIENSKNFAYGDSSARKTSILEATYSRHMWRDVGHQNRNRVIRKFSLESVLAKYMKLFRDLASVDYDNSSKH